MTQRSTATLIALPVLGLLLFLMGFVNTPYVVFSPGITVDVLGEFEGESVVQVTGAKTYDDDGALRMTTVYRTPPAGRVSLLYAVQAWLDRDEAVYQREAIYPEGQTNEQSREESAVEMVSSQDAATANALRQLGYDVREVTEVLSVSPDLPAQGKLEVRDVFLRVGDQRVTSPTRLVELVQAAPAGEPLTFTIRRDGERRQVTITPAVVDGKNRVGVVPGPGYVFPFDVRFNIDQNIGGPSAGLMFSLALYDVLTPGSLTNGGTIAGTGTIDDAGQVGPIGGIQQKIVAAREDGAGLFLVPSDNCDEVDGARPGDMRLVRATTMPQALEAVEAWADDHEADLPSCDPEDDPDATTEDAA